MLVANKPLNLLFHEPGTIFPSNSASLGMKLHNDAPRCGWAQVAGTGGPDESQGGTRGLYKQVILIKEFRTSLQPSGRNPLQTYHIPWLRVMRILSCTGSMEIFRTGIRRSGILSSSRSFYLYMTLKSLLYFSLDIHILSSLLAKIQTQGWFCCSDDPCAQWLLWHDFLLVSGAWGEKQISLSSLCLFLAMPFDLSGPWLPDLHKVIQNSIALRMQPVTSAHLTPVFVLPQPSFYSQTQPASVSLHLQSPPHTQPFFVICHSAQNLYTSFSNESRVISSSYSLSHHLSYRFQQDFVLQIQCTYVFVTHGLSVCPKLMHCLRRRVQSILFVLYSQCLTKFLARSRFMITTD